AEPLSLHFFEAHRFEEAWRYSQIAGGRAQAIYANVDAATFYERALQAEKRLRGHTKREVGELSEALGDARFRSGQFGKAALAYGEARRLLAEDPVAEARIL